MFSKSLTAPAAPSFRHSVVPGDRSLPLGGRIAFYGRTLADYAEVLGFDPDRLRSRRFLDVAAGPSSFTCEATLAGAHAIAVDPLYRFRGPALRERFARDFADVAACVSNHRTRFCQSFEKAEAGDSIADRRRRATRRFLLDYRAGVAGGRYRAAALPQLPFPDAIFDTVLCGHFLFLYEHLFDAAFHRQACRELLRVCRGEVRIYPLTRFDGTPSQVLEGLLTELRGEGVTTTVETLASPMLEGADQRLILRRA